MAWTQQQAEAVRQAKGHYSVMELARKLCVSPETIRRLWRGETYSNTKEAPCAPD